MEITYVNITREDCFTPERAEAMAAAHAKLEKEEREKYGEIPTTISRRVEDSIVITLKYASINAYQLTKLFRAQGDREHFDPDALILGTPGASRREARNGFDAPLLGDKFDEKREFRARHVGGSPLGSSA